MKSNISFFAFLKQWFFLKRKSVQLSFAIKLCDLKQQAFNRRYFVLLDPNDKLISLSREDVKRMKRLKLIRKNITHLDLMEKAFYYTPLSRNDKNGISKKEQLKRRKTYMDYVKFKNKLSI